jgi:hypothetical protein
MQLSFPSNKSIELAFKVGIAGTASAPQSVAVVLERGTTAVSFAATKDGDDWKAVIESPGSMFGTGEVKLSVNVVLNNRLFTPMKSVAEIVGEVDEPIAQVMPAPEKVEPETVEEPVAQEATVQDIVPEPSPTVAPKKTSLLPSIQAATQEAVVEAPTPVVVETIAAPAPKKITAEDLRAMGIGGKKVEESVEIVQPVRLQLLRSIEPGIVRKVQEKIAEAKQPAKAPEAVFKLKKTKVIFK